MIVAAPMHLAGSLNEFLTRGLGLTEDIPVVSPLTELNGSPVAGLGNKLVLFLAGLERDYGPVSASGAPAGGNFIARSQTPVHLNLFVMVAASFAGRNYLEGLRMLSAAILFFQKNPVFSFTIFATKINPHYQFCVHW